MSLDAAQIEIADERSNLGILRRVIAASIARCKSRLSQADPGRQRMFLDALIATGALTIGIFLASCLETAVVPSASRRIWIALAAAAASTPIFLVGRRHIRTLSGCPYLGRGFARDPYANGDTMLGEVEAEGMLRCAAEHLRMVFQSRSVAIFTRSPRDYAFCLAGQAGLPEGTTAVFERDSVLLGSLHATSVPPLKDLPACEALKLRATGGALLVPVRLSDHLAAFINLGRKVSGRGYNGHDMALLSTMAGQLALALNHVRLSRQEREDECARSIQEALLPREIPQLEGFEIATAWQPARKVSGDYFDVLPLGGKLGICIADVAGKGVPAALLMSNVQAAVRALAVGDLGSAELCGRVNRIISGNIPPGRFITFFYAVLDATENSLTYTNAGHNPPLIVRRDGTCTWLGAGGPVLGIFPEAAYAQETTRFRCGDRLILFTDGLIEAGNSTGNEFGEERVAALALQNPRAGARALRSAIMESLHAFGGGDPEDDVTLVVVTARGHASCKECPLAQPL